MITNPVAIFSILSLVVFGMIWLERIPNFRKLGAAAGSIPAPTPSPTSPVSPWLMTSSAAQPTPTANHYGPMRPEPRSNAICCLNTSWEQSPTSADPTKPPT